MWPTQRATETEAKTMDAQTIFGTATLRRAEIEGLIPSAKGAHRECLNVALQAWGNAQLSAKRCLKPGRDRYLAKAVERFQVAQEIDARLASDFG